jgi:hypothetical protein
MVYFSDSQPNLLNKRTVKTLEKLLNQPLPADNGNISNGAQTLYKTYIEPNMFVIIIFVLIALFLYYKYVTKQDKKESEQFNPSIPVAEQQSNINYLDDNIPVNINGNIMTHRDIYGDNIQQPINMQGTSINRTHTGDVNTYLNSHDTMFMNPLGYPNDYNAHNEFALGRFTDKNRANLDELTKLVFNEQNDMIVNAFDTNSAYYIEPAFTEL